MNAPEMNYISALSTMEEGTTATSPDYHFWFDKFKQSDPVSSTVSFKDAAYLYAEENIDNIQLDDAIQYLPQEISQLTLNHHVQPEASHQMVHVSHHQNLPVNQPPTCSWNPPTAHIEPPMNIPQPAYEVDSATGQMVAYAQPSTYAPACQQSTIVVDPQQHHVQSMVEYNQTPVDVPYFAYTDQVIKSSVTSDSEEYSAGYTVHSLPPVDQWYPAADAGVRTATACEKENWDSQAEMGVAGLQDQWCTTVYDKEYVSQAEMRPSVSACQVTPPKYACSFCDQKFERKRIMMAHVRAHHRGERPYKCQYEGCGKEYIWIDALRRHDVKFHSEEGNVVEIPDLEKTNFVCRFCHIKFATKKSALGHIRVDHAEMIARKQRYHCFFCKRDYSSDDSRYVHMRQKHNWHNDA